MGLHQQWRKAPSGLRTPLTNIPPHETVKLVFNLSQGEDERGPWNEEPDFEYVENPEPEGGLPPEPINPDDEGHKPSPGKARASRRTN